MKVILPVPTRYVSTSYNITCYLHMYDTVYVLYTHTSNVVTVDYRSNDKDVLASTLA
jgi:hypothetical protein